MFQLIVTDSFNNDDLPTSQVGSTLNLPSSLATWELLNGYDYSNNGHHLVLSGGGLSYDNLGLVSAGIVGEFAGSDLTEPDTFSVIVAFNVTTSARTSQLWSTLEGSETYYRGCRQALVTAGYVTSQAFAGDGSVAAAASLSSGAITDMWDIYYYSVSATEMRTMRGSTGGATSSAINNTRRKSVNPFRLMGGHLAPHNYSPIGHMGLMAVYDGVLGDKVAAQQIAKAKAIMQARGANLSW